MSPFRSDSSLGPTKHLWFRNSLLTVVILDAQHEVAAGVTHCFHRDAGELVHGGLGKQLPCTMEKKTGLLIRGVIDTGPAGRHRHRVYSALSAKQIKLKSRSSRRE